MMKHVGRVLAIVAASTLSLTACGAETEDDLIDVEERWGWPDPPPYPGNGDISIHVGPTTEIAGCLAWDIVNDETSDANGDPVNRVDGDLILDPTGNVLCQQIGGQLEGVDHIMREDGQGGNEILFTVWRRYVLPGDVEIPHHWWWDWEFLELLRDEALTFKQDQVFRGAPWKGDVLITATEHLRFADQMRKLLLGALIEGECGSAGLPDYTPPT